MRDTKYETGSALILAVVLTSLLAIVGVTFVMVARVDKTATSAITANKELSFAVDTVISKISQELVLDVPGVDPSAEYHDYPGNEDRWLASLEPYYEPNAISNYYWPQISSINNALGTSELALLATIIKDHQPIISEGLKADADGDGVADAIWVELTDMTSSKGQPIYAAVRIVDNGGMLNVNTAYKFDPNESLENIDGSSQIQTNLMALAWRLGSTVLQPGEETELLDARANYGIGVDPLNLDEYEKNVIWRYHEPNGPYTPFDISDELELRNRFLLNHSDIDTRLEVWGGEFRNSSVIDTPVTSGGQDLDKWYRKAYDNGSLDPNYAYRHISTVYNMDRIIDPNGSKMLNANIKLLDADEVNDVYNTILDSLINANSSFVNVNAIAAQMAVNILDFVDNDSNVTDFNHPVTGDVYYGFEQPCIYISELAQSLHDPINSFNLLNPDLDDPNIFVSYAIVLYKPYATDIDPNGWKITVEGNPSVDINWSGSGLFNVLWFEDTNAPANRRLAQNPGDVDPNNVSADIKFVGGKRVTLTRDVDGNDIIVDDVTTLADLNGEWLDTDPITNYVRRSFKRDISAHKCIRRLWDDSLSNTNILIFGNDNNYDSGIPGQIQAHPANTDFTNIGEIGMVFSKGTYYRDGEDPVALGIVGYGANTEDEVRINLADPNFQMIFNYLTVLDPTTDKIDNDGDGLGATGADPNELKIPGRININTAPWFVLAQLPWLSQRRGKLVNETAQDIVLLREQLGGFKSIAEINIGEPNDPNFSIHDYYGQDGVDLDNFPDLTPNDGAPDDFEERDIIFHRISNLVTVRSDVFTAYILVRIGRDGPQKRVIAILDRSDVYSGDDRVKVRALHLVPDPR